MRLGKGQLLFNVDSNIYSYMASFSTMMNKPWHSMKWNMIFQFL